MKKYKAIIFDWDGTAVVSRTAPADDVLPLMTELLKEGVLLVIISGTTYENINSGKLHLSIPQEALCNLYMGLGRGAYNYGFDSEGQPVILHNALPGREMLVKVHDMAFEMHRYLFSNFGYNTDIVFTRPNYCKIDLLADIDRGDKLHFQRGELDLVNLNLKKYGYNGGIRRLMQDTLIIGERLGLRVKPTTDAKYLEIGLTTKADNVDFFLENIIFKKGINIEECCFWGDEFTYIDDGIKGSDAQMITLKSINADFFDVMDSPIQLPGEVRHIGGGVSSFLKFLEMHINL